MQRNLKAKTRKRRTSLGEYVLFLLIGSFAFISAGELHNRDIPNKSASAIMTTLVTFGIVVIFAAGCGLDGHSGSQLPSASQFTQS